MVPFNRVAQVEIGRGFATIERADRQRVISVTADLDQDVANAEEVNADLRANIMPGLLQDYPGLRYSMEGATAGTGREPGQPEVRLRAGAAHDLRVAGRALQELHAAHHRHERHSLRTGGRHLGPHHHGPGPDAHLHVRRGGADGCGGERLAHHDRLHQPRPAPGAAPVPGR